MRHTPTARRIPLATSFAAVAALTGCASYYRVTVPNTETAYYTTDVDHKGGNVTFTDARTDREVTLQTSEVEKISKADYMAAVKP